MLVIFWDAVQPFSEAIIIGRSKIYLKYLDKGLSVWIEYCLLKCVMCHLLFYGVSYNLLIIFFFYFKHIWEEHTQNFHFEGIVFWLHDSFLYHRSMHGLILKELFDSCFVILKYCWYTLKNECNLSVSIAFWFAFQYVWVFWRPCTFPKRIFSNFEICFSCNFVFFLVSLKNIPTIPVLFFVTNFITV